MTTSNIDLLTADRLRRMVDIDRLRATAVALLTERDIAWDEVRKLRDERNEARAQAERHLEHLRQAHPLHFKPNVLGQRLCGCGGQWPCPTYSTPDAHVGEEHS